MHGGENGERLRAASERSPLPVRPLATVRDSTDRLRSAALTHSNTQQSVREFAFGDDDIQICVCTTYIRANRPGARHSSTRIIDLTGAEAAQERRRTRVKGTGVESVERREAVEDGGRRAVSGTEHWRSVVMVGAERVAIEAVEAVETGVGRGRRGGQAVPGVTALVGPLVDRDADRRGERRRPREWRQTIHLCGIYGATDDMPLDTNSASILVFFLFPHFDSLWLTVFLYSSPTRHNNNKSHAGMRNAVLRRASSTEVSQFLSRFFQHS